MATIIGKVLTYCSSRHSSTSCYLVRTWPSIYTLDFYQYVVAPIHEAERNHRYVDLKQQRAADIVAPEAFGVEFVLNT